MLPRTWTTATRRQQARRLFAIHTLCAARAERPAPCRASPWCTCVCDITTPNSDSLSLSDIKIGTAELKNKYNTQFEGEKITYRDSRPRVGSIPRVRPRYNPCSLTSLVGVPMMVPPNRCKFERIFEQQEETKGILWKRLRSNAEVAN